MMRFRIGINWGALILAAVVVGVILIVKALGF